MMNHVSKNSPPVDETCPLCRQSQGEFFFADRRNFFRCSICGLVFVLPEQFLSSQEEKAVYDQHENSPDDVRYRQFLSRMFEPMISRLLPGSKGLDYGSGPGPTLSIMFEEAGHPMSIYDPFYAPDADSLSRQYDFITATEVVEHLHQPLEDLNRLWNCLKPNGWLGLMTKRVASPSDFATWHYKNDPTHVCFFSMKTFQWLAAYWKAELIVAGNDVVLFRKTARCS